MANDKQQTRLNYIIPNDIEKDLADYCSFTGRTAADVTRQLIVEYIEDSVTISSKFSREVVGKRTNLTMNSLVLEDFDIKTINVGTRSAVIAKLLSDYLVSRSSSQESNDTSYRDSRSFRLLNELVTACDARNSVKDSGDAVVDANYWRALYACRVFIDEEVKLNVC